MYLPIRDKRVQNLSKDVCGGGFKGIKLWRMGEGPPDSPLSMGPECPRYANANI